MAAAEAAARAEAEAAAEAAKSPEQRAQEAEAILTLAAPLTQTLTPT